ncbi:DUF6884 domain-containing protein [Blastococcus sp. SYSU D00669]
MSTGGLPTIWDLLAEAAATLPEPFTRAALINWVSARRPDVGVASIASHISLATDNATHAGTTPFAGRTPLLHRVERGTYRRHRPPAPARYAPPGLPPHPAAEAGRVVLIGSSGAIATGVQPAARLFESAGFARARAYAERSGHPWFVLSAKHGLLDPDDVVGPFAVLFGDQSVGYRTAWADWVVAQLADRTRLPGMTVEVHGGVDFAQPLRNPLARRGAALEIPLPDMWLGPDEPGSPASPLGRLRGLVHRRRA